MPGVKSWTWGTEGVCGAVLLRGHLLSRQAIPAASDARDTSGVQANRSPADADAPPQRGAHGQAALSVNFTASPRQIISRRAEPLPIGVNIAAQSQPTAEGPPKIISENRYGFTFVSAQPRHGVAHINGTEKINQNVTEEPQPKESPCRESKTPRRKVPKRINSDAKSQK
jgi:hypothetical protein